MNHVRRLVVVLLCGLLGAAVLSVPPASAAPVPAKPVVRSVVATDTGSLVEDAAAITVSFGSESTGLAGFEVQLLDGPTLSDVVQTIRLDVDLPLGGERVMTFYDAAFGHAYDVRARSFAVVDGTDQYSDYGYWSTSGVSGAGPVVPLLQVKPARDVVVTAPYTTALQVTWKAPVADPATETVTGYTIFARQTTGETDMPAQTNESSWDCAVPCTSVTLRGLRNGTGYVVFVRSRSDDIYFTPPPPPVTVVPRWNLPYASGVPFGAPSAPSKLTATRTGSRARLMWAATLPSGNPIDSYKVYVNGKFRKTVKASRSVYTHVLMVTGIKKKKTYSFIVRAYNAHGYSAPLKITKRWK